MCLTDIALGQSLEVAGWYNDGWDDESHVVYVGDARTVAARLPLIKQYHLAGVAFWVLGREDPVIYSHVQEMLP